MMMPRIEQTTASWLAAISLAAYAVLCPCERSGFAGNVAEQGKLALDRVPKAKFRLAGPVGERIKNNVDRWLTRAPQNNREIPLGRSEEGGSINPWLGQSLQAEHVAQPHIDDERSLATTVEVVRSVESITPPQPIGPVYSENRKNAKKTPPHEGFHLVVIAHKGSAKRELPLLAAKPAGRPVSPREKASHGGAGTVGSHFRRST